MTTEIHISKEELFTQIKVNEDKLRVLCREKGVKSLSIFGSVVRGQFKANQSDLDFLVEFDTISADRFFDFLDGLKKIFNYDNVELITLASLKNQVIREEVLSSQENIYAA